MANQVIRLLFGVQGDDNIAVSGSSGYLIKNSIEGICKKIKDGGHSDIEFAASQASLDKIKNDIAEAVRDINAGITINEVQLGEEVISNLRTQLEEALKGLTVKIDDSNAKRRRKRSGGGGSGGGSDEFAETRSALRSLMTLWQQYEYWSGRAMRAPVENGVQQQQMLNQVNNIVDNIRDRLQDMAEASELDIDFNLDESTLGSLNDIIDRIIWMEDNGDEGLQRVIAEASRLHEMMDNTDFEASLFSGGMIDKSSVKAGVEQYKQALDLQKELFKYRRKAAVDTNVVGKENEHAAYKKLVTDTQAAADAAFAKLDASQKLAIERYIANEQRKLDAAKALHEAHMADVAAKEKAANDAEPVDDTAEKEAKARKDAVDDLIKSYQKYHQLKLEADKLALSGKDNESAVYAGRAEDALQGIVDTQKKLALSGEEVAAVEQAIQKEYKESREELELYVARLKDRQKAENKTNKSDVTLKSASPLYQMSSLMNEFDKRFQYTSKQGYVDDENLANYQARFADIQQRFKDLIDDAQRFEDAFARINKGEMDGLISDIKNLTSEIKTADDAAGRFSREITKNQNSFNKLANRAQDYFSRIETTLARDPARLRELQQLIEKLHNGPENFKSVTEASAAFQKLQYDIKQAGLETETLWQTINRIMKTKLGYGVAGSAALALRNQLDDVYKYVVEIDTKMTDLQIVSGATGTEMARTLDDAADAAKRVAAALTDVIDATTVYRRLGFDVDKSLKFAELTTMYSKVGDVEIGQAEDNLTAIIQAFDFKTPEKLSLAMDQLVKVANDYAIDAQGIGDGLNDAASALIAANNTYEEAVALLTASNSITQDAKKSSTALRTIAARLRQSSTELEELGEDPLSSDYDTQSKYRDKLMAMTGVDILEADQQTYKSTIQILRELAAAWEDISDVDKASVTYMVAGTRQMNVFSSLMQNFQEAENVLETAANAEGTMARAYESYTDSIEGRLNTLLATFQDLSVSLLDSDLIKTAVSGLTSLVDAVDNLVDAVGLLGPALAGVGIWQFIKSVGGAKMIALLSAPTYVPVVTRNEHAA